MRFNHPATMHEVNVAAPAVFSREQHPNLLPGYEFVPTHKVVTAFLDNGYGISRAQQVQSKDRYGAHTGKHIICFRPVDSFTDLEVGEYIPEVVYTASHDGSSAMHLYGGLFRVICTNGMITGEKWVSHRITHKKGAESMALASADAIMAQMPNLAARIQDMKKRELSPAEQVEFARRAMALRWEDSQPFAHDQLLAIRRMDDAGANLWRVLNRIQENIMKGGISYTGPKGRATATKPLERITADVSINRGLWDMAEELLTA